MRGGERRACNALIFVRWWRPTERAPAGTVRPLHLLKQTTVFDVSSRLHAIFLNVV